MLRFHSVKELEQQKEAVCKVGSDFLVRFRRYAGTLGMIRIWYSASVAIRDFIRVV